MASESNAALVAAIRGGDVSRFGEVVRRFDRAVRAVVSLSVPDPDSREEIVQQTFYFAFKRLDTLATPESLRAWLLAIARNCVADHHRRRARQASQPLASTSEAPEPSASWIWEEVHALPPAFGEVLRLRYRDRLSYAEIATRLQVPLSTVRGRIYQARRALRRRLEEDRQ